MSTQVVRVEGYNKGSLGTIGRECDRAEGVNHRNQDIDGERSGLNVSYKEAPQGFTAEYADIVTTLNASGKETKKGVAFEGMIITADLPFFERLGYEQGKPLPKEVKAFFDRSYEFAKAQIGYQGTDKNILSAKIHLDEKTPHLHLYYVPVTDKWQTKVYAKGEDGKVLRSERGTPIQAKGADGKTLYEQHEDKTAPKLSRTEFWRVRGGQSSYRMMQDRFQEQVGKQYGLDRGEVGSDREHKKTAVFKQEELTAETQKLTEKVEPLRQLKTGIDEVEAPGKTVLPGIVAVKKKDLAALKEQASAYAVNRDEIGSVRERAAAVERREQAADRREGQLDNKANELAQRAADIQQQYQRQLSLNQLLEQTEKQRDGYKAKCTLLERENGSLRAEIEKVRETLTKQIEALKTTVRGAYDSLRNVVKAIGMLKYDKDDGYKVEGLTAKQEKLIDGVATYASKWAKEDGHPDIAEDMDKHIGISKGIQAEITPPRQHYQSHDYGPSL
jgi:hypothetical protein